MTPGDLRPERTDTKCCILYLEYYYQISLVFECKLPLAPVHRATQDYKKRMGEPLSDQSHSLAQQASNQQMFLGPLLRS